MGIMQETAIPIPIPVSSSAVHCRPLPPIATQCQSQSQSDSGVSHTGKKKVLPPVALFNSLPPFVYILTNVYKYFRCPRELTELNTDTYTGGIGAVWCGATGCSGDAAAVHPEHHDTSWEWAGAWTWAWRCFCYRKGDVDRDPRGRERA